MSEELAYLAGFIDGEGSIRVGTGYSPSRERRWYLMFSCHQVNPLPLCLLKARFGGTIRSTHRQGQRKLYEWTITSAQAGDAIAALRPWLHVKADEADIALEFQAMLAANANRRRPLTDLDKAKREACYQKLRDLKHRPYDEA